MSSSNSTTKRRRIGAGSSSLQRRHRHIIRITDLPSGILGNVASFLAAPSRVLFSAALVATAPTNNASTSSERTTKDDMIIADDDQWDVLDFGDIEKNLAAALSDDDISTVLLRIDAVNKLKRLKLTNCVNTTGAGLEPLSGSVIIEQIDLSLVGDGVSPELFLTPPILCNHVLPILHNIIDNEENALKQLQFPRAWRDDRANRSGDSDFHQFLQQYNEMLENRGRYCVQCDERLILDGIFTGDDGGLYGLPFCICYGCLEHYCEDCTNENNISFLRCCGVCERDYCTRCVKISNCNDCGTVSCARCKDFVDCCRHGCYKTCCDRCAKKCLKCDKSWCKDCSNYRVCNNCDKICVECSEEEGVNVVRSCNDAYCGNFLCQDCRMMLCELGEIDCDQCIAMVFPVIAERAQELVEEVDELKNENNDLKDEINDLKDEIDDLKGEVKDLQDEVKDLKDENKYLKDENKLLRDKIKEFEGLS